MIALAALLTVCLVAVTAGPSAASPLPPQIHTVAGGGSCSGPVTSGGLCDGVSATSVPIETARSVAALPGGGYLYIDEANDLVREVLPNGKVTTVAGTSTFSHTNQPIPSTADQDGVPATLSGLDDPVAVAPLPDGGFLITEFAGARVRMVSPGPPGQATITTIAGIPPAGSPAPVGCNTGAPGTGTSVALNHPLDAVPTASGGVLIADTYNDQILLLSSADPCAAIQQIAGGLDLPDSVSELPDGSGAYLVSELGADAVLEISQEAPTGTFTTVAGQPGAPGYFGDGGPATAALLNAPDQVVATAGGGFLIADTGNDVVRQVSPAGLISTIAGDGAIGYTGDGLAATAAELNGPAAVAPTVANGILIADENNSAIREITQPPVTTIALNPSSPSGGNGWYLTYPPVTITATEKATIACVLDPAQPPPAFGAIAPGCAFGAPGAVVRGNGTHTIYAASQNSFGDQENPVGVTFKVDATPPKLTCPKEQEFPYGKRRATVTGTLTDKISGPKSKRISARADTSALGAGTVSLFGVNNAGTASTVQCPYLVAPLEMKPLPAASSMLAVSSRKQLAVVKQLMLTGVPKGAAVALACQGKTCPFKLERDVQTGSGGGSGAGQTTDLAGLLKGAKLGFGTAISLAVTRAHTVGRYLTLTITPAKHPALSSVCLPPGAISPTGKACTPKLPRK